MLPSILLVQPDPTQSRRLHQLLFDQGHESRSVGNGEEALALLKSTDAIDLVVLELGLPVMDGFQLVEELRKYRSPEQTAVVVITAYPGMMFRAIREKKALGLEAVVSSKATAVSLHEIFDKVLSARPSKQSKSMLIPLEAFNQLAATKEAKRLARIAALHLDPGLGVDEAILKLAKETALAFDFPVVLISLTLQERHHFKGHIGLRGRHTDERDSARDWSSCIRDVDSANPSLLVLPDVRKHRFFQQNPLVIAGDVVSYTAAPVVTSENAVLGTLSLIDSKPRKPSQAELDLLTALTRRVAGEIEVQQRMRSLKQDLSHQWDKLAEHTEQMEMLKAILETLHLGILLHDAQKQVVLANERLCALTGFDRAYVESGDAERFAVDLLALFDDPDAVAHKLMVLEAGPYMATETFAMQRPRRQFIRWTARPVHVGEGWYQLSTYEDITAEIDLEVERERLSTMDAVSGLLNRRAAEEEGMREAERARRKKRPYAVLRLALDGLSDLNAEKGFGEGDGLLRAVADCLRRCLRIEDRPARWSGRQFIVLLPETREPEAQLVARRIAAAVAKIDVGLPIRLTGGLACSDDDYAFASVLDLAEQRLSLALANAPGEIL